MPYLSAIGTAVPAYAYKQNDLANFMTRLLDAKGTETERKIKALYHKSAIETRHSVLPDYAGNGHRELFPDSADFEPQPSVDQRMKAFNAHAVPLLLQAIEDTLQQASCSTEAITHIITVSCTGLRAPGIELDLIERLGLAPNIERYAINFVGCYAAFNAMKLADNICRANDNAVVLIASVELCSLHFQKSTDNDSLLANALFADGAAAALVTSQTPAIPALQTQQFISHILPQGKSDMAWEVSSTGFLMTLTSYVPELVDVGMEPLMQALLQQAGIQPEEVGYWAVHPGGRKILEAAHHALGLTNGALDASKKVLSNYGNMSAPTILFVLREMMANKISTDNPKPVVACGFGPGLSLEAAVFIPSC